ANFHGYDDPTIHATWDIWDLVFPGGSIPAGQTVKGILSANGIDVPILSDECGSTATGTAQWATNKKFLDQAPGRSCGSYIFSLLVDNAGGFQIIDGGPPYTERPAYTNMVAYVAAH